MKLHEKIAWYRRDRRLSQEELAAQTGVSRQAVSKWELGESSPDVNKLLARPGPSASPPTTFSMTGRSRSGPPHRPRSSPGRTLRPRPGPGPTPTSPA